MNELCPVEPVYFSDEKSATVLRDDKHITMQYTKWINSAPSQEYLLSCLAQWLEHSVYNRGVARSSPIIGRHNVF